MLLSDIIRRVRNTAGDIDAMQFSNEILVDWVNDAIKEIAVSNALLQKNATQNSVVNQADYDLPPDIFKLHSILYGGRKLPVKTKQEFDELNSGEPNTGQAPVGAPQYAYVWASKLTLFPSPDTVQQIKIQYIYEPANLVTLNPETQTPAIPPSYHLRIVTYCLAQIALMDEDYNKYQALLQAFETGVVAVKHQGESEEDVYPSISVSTRDMGNSYTSWEY